MLPLNSRNGVRRGQVFLLPPCLRTPVRMLGQGHPEADRVGTRGHVVAVDVVRIGDPEARHRVVRRQQHVLGLLAAVRRRRPRSALSGRGEVGRLARHGRVALGLDRQVVDELVAVLDAVLQEEAVADGVVGHVVLDPQVVRAVHGHAAAVGVMDRGVPDVLALAFADQVPVDRIAGERQVLAHARQLDTRDIHLGSTAIAMMCPPK